MQTISFPARKIGNTLAQIVAGEKEIPQKGECHRLVTLRRRRHHFRKNCPIAVEYLLLLRRIPGPDAGTNADDLVLPRTLRDNVPQQRGLAATVGPDDRHPLAAGDVQVNVLQERQVAERLAVTSQLQDDICPRPLSCEFGVDRRHTHRRFFDCLRLLTRKLRAPCAKSFAGIHTRTRPRRQLKSFHERLKLRQPFLVRTVVSLLGDELAEVGGPVRRVAALVPLHPTVFKRQDSLHYPVQRMAVVRDDQHGALEIDQELFEPR